MKAIIMGVNAGNDTDTVATIVGAIAGILAKKDDFTGKRVLITAGATRERLDPVRFLTNDSSGKMGFALAESARDRGAETTVVCGSVTAPIPAGVRVLRIESAAELLDVMIKEAPQHDIIIQAAAVADYRPENIQAEKIKKNGSGEMTLKLVENPDVAKAVGEIKKAGQILVGFAAETNCVTEHAREKLRKKNLDMIVANDVTREGAGFNTDTNIATLMTADMVKELPLMTKRELADMILDQINVIRDGIQSLPD